MSAGKPAFVNLALQGGGAHGAFTWGVLDRLLEAPGIAVEGISGTSAGAMNAAVFAAGMAEGGREGARSRLDRFWERVADLDRFSPIQRTAWNVFTEDYNIDTSPGLALVESVMRSFSPYQVNPLDFNPLRDILDDLVDFDRLRADDAVKLFVSATNVRTGRARIFANAEMSIDALLASSCLPQLFQAVEIDGEAYWDGGFMGNPAIYPLIYNCASRDVVVVQINPLERPGLPTTARAIQDRMNEISFNASLMHEMRAIAFVERLIARGALDPDEYKALRVHLIADEEALNGFGSASKLSGDREFLAVLKGIGRTAADRWIADHADKLGRESSIDVRKTYL